MSEERDAQGEGLPQLPDVFRALREEGPGRARLDEIARRLGPALDAPLPHAATAGLFARLFKTKLAAGKFLAAVLTFGALATIAVWPERSPAPQSVLPARRDVAQPRANPASQNEAPPQEAIAAPAAPGVPEAEAVPEVVPPPSPAPREAKLEDSSAAHAKRRAARAAHVSTRSPIEPLAGATKSPTELPAAGSRDALEAAPEEHEPARAFVADAQVPHEAEPEPPPAARPKSEIDLVFEARTLAKTDPAGALRLIDEHVQRYPDGLLVPEREVLAIEVLRRLGQNDAAAARLSLFRKRYPGSVHLRRLEGASL